jgi:hypothetical protein
MTSHEFPNLNKNPMIKKSMMKILKKNAFNVTEDENVDNLKLVTDAMRGRIYDNFKIRDDIVRELKKKGLKEVKWNCLPKLVEHCKKRREIKVRRIIVLTRSNHYWMIKNNMKRLLRI